MPLTPEDFERYGRQIVLPEIGVEGQERLQEARVLVVGAGGLGSPAALYLAAAGVGRLGVVDFDRVERSNLHRQVLFVDADLGQPKASTAAARLTALNPNIALEVHDTRLDEGTASQLIAEYDVVVDGSDNFATRYAVNDACVALGRPDVFGSVLKFEGQVSVFAAADGPCYRCLHREAPPAGMVPSCAEAGVVGALPGIIGSLQALEAVKLVLGVGRPLVGRLLVYDGLETSVREISVPRDPACPVCGGEESRAAQPAEARASVPGLHRMPTNEIPFEVSPVEVESWRAEGKHFRFLDVRLPRERDIATITGTTLLPLHELPNRFAELDPDEPLVVMCHHGIRSAQAVAFLRQQGFAWVRNLTGGIAAWSRDVDPSIPQY